MATTQVTRMADFKVADDNYPLANTRAARLFTTALDRMEREQGKSQRTLAKELGYKSSVVLSHMSSGRAPIPIDRVPDFARALKMDYPEFLLAVLQQRHPQIDFLKTLVGNKDKLAKGAVDGDMAVLEDLKACAGGSLVEMTPDQYNILREVAADKQASRRWMSTSEMSVVEQCRFEAPDLIDRGLSPTQRAKLKEFIREI